jgi:SAM-dependent methyltransferase
MASADRHDDVAAVRAKLAGGNYGSRTRGLGDVNERLGASGTTLEQAIADQLVHRSPVSVLEIGFGWGAALIELAWRFRDEPVSFAGINLERKRPVRRAADLAIVAEALELIPPDEIAAFTPPDVHFYDATTLQHDDEALDLVYSAVTLRFVPDKVRVIEEVARVLRPGGRAILDVAERGWEYPGGPAAHPRLLTEHPAYLVLHHELELVPLAEYLAFAGGDRFTIRVPSGRRCTVGIIKHARGLLDTGLALDPERTIPMSEFPTPPDYRRPGSGVMRSAYTVARDRMAEYAARRAALADEAGRPRRASG